MKLCTVICLLLKLNSIRVCVADSTYKTYVAKVLNHIRNEKTRESLQHIVVKDTAIENPNDFWDFNAPVTQHSAAMTLKFMKYLLNYRFGEFLSLFHYKFFFGVDNCARLFDKQLLDEFVDCVQQMYDVLKNSKTMFKCLYNAVEFVSDLDLKLINPIMDGPESIVEIFRVYRDFTESIATQKRPEFSDANQNPNVAVATSVHLGMTMFYNEVSVPNIGKLGDFINQYCGVFDDEIPKDLMIVYSDESKIRENFFFYTYLIIVCCELNQLYETVVDTVLNVYGFQKLLYNKFDTFASPKELKLHQENVVKIFNNIVKHGSQYMEHINIIVNHRSLINSKYILQDEIIKYSDDRNRITNIAHLIECRFSEIFKNFHISLNALIRVCNHVRKKCNESLFTDCAKDFHYTVERTFNMFDIMGKILYTIRLGSSKPNTLKTNWCVETHIESYRNRVKEINQRVFNLRKVVAEEMRERSIAMSFYESLSYYWLKIYHRTFNLFFNATIKSCRLNSSFFASTEVMIQHFLNSQPPDKNELQYIIKPIKEYTVDHFDNIVNNELIIMSS